LTQRGFENRLREQILSGGFIYMSKYESADLLLKLYDLRREEKMPKSPRLDVQFQSEKR
jgi:hypothetical protein